MNEALQLPGVAVPASHVARGKKLHVPLPWQVLSQR
jgi:hypothetical protein